MTPRRLSDADYARLLELRDGLRAFLKWSGHRAEEAGVTPAQHQLLLTVRGHDHPDGPTISDIADHLMLKHNSAVELIHRGEAAGLITRTTDPSDARMARIHLTDKGAEILGSLSELHLSELRRLGSRISPIWTGLRDES